MTTTAHWACLSCDEHGDLDEIKPNSGPDVAHSRESGHGVTSWVGGGDE